jgi:mxaA protein
MWPTPNTRLRPVLVAVLWFALLPPAARAAEPEQATLQARTVEPRAFGYRVGDVAERQVVIDIPAHLTLDEASLPTLGPHGPVLELRSMGRSVQSMPGGRRLSLRLTYQVFAAPVTVRSYELPKLLLRFDGNPHEETHGRAQVSSFPSGGGRLGRPGGAVTEELRIEPWPLVVAALAAEEASPREGLGALRPDTAPPVRDTGIERGLLWACAGAALLLGAYLGLVYLGLPWWGRQRRPFTRAFRAMRVRAPARGAADLRAACLALHAAFDETAGRTVFAGALDTFIAQAPRFAALRSDMRLFFERSQAMFFAQADAPGGERAGTPLSRDWLLAFARACRDAERGSGSGPARGG